MTISQLWGSARSFFDSPIPTSSIDLYSNSCGHEEIVVIHSLTFTERQNVKDDSHVLLDEPDHTDRDAILVKDLVFVEVGRYCARGCVDDVAQEPWLGIPQGHIHFHDRECVRICRLESGS